MQDSLYYYFDGLDFPVQLTACQHLIEDFPILFPEQDYQPGQAHDHPLISLRFDDEAYHISASWMDESKRYTDKVDVLCELVAKLTYARSFYDQQALYLHAAGVEVNGRLVIFPSQYRAGKSFLTACLVAAGHRYLSDDVVPLILDNGKARSPGFAPRLRLPLPETTDAQSKQFIDRHMALAGKRYAYLQLETALITRKAEDIDIGAFVLLKREAGVRAELEALPVATVFQQLIKQNFARELDGARILAALTRAVSSAQCFKLRYDRADEAVQLLSERFSHWPTPSDAQSIEANNTFATSQSAENRSDDAFIRHPQAQQIGIEGESFLTSPDGKAIYHLNLIGSGIWELLAEPITKPEIVSILAEAFPQVEQSIIDNDVTAILEKFQSTNLISH